MTLKVIEKLDSIGAQFPYVNDTELSWQNFLPKMAFPPKWIHCVLIQGDSVALSANFLSFGQSRL